MTARPKRYLAFQTIQKTRPRGVRGLVSVGFNPGRIVFLKRSPVLPVVRQPTHRHGILCRPAGLPG
jgi:hypothetical protein